MIVFGINEHLASKLNHSIHQLKFLNEDYLLSHSDSLVISLLTYQGKTLPLVSVLRACSPCGSNFFNLAFAAAHDIQAFITTIKFEF